jgi:phospholipid/cholesterol/gamma-HCH transport system substrate-binding protein
METRAHHLLIGSFALGITALIFLFVIWLSKAQFDAEFATYQVRFEGSVSGLRKSADVLFNGLKVGEVTDLQIDKDDPNKVVAFMRVAAMTPVKADSIATLEFQGLTGLAAILISGGTKKGGEPATAKGDDYPSIKAGKSKFEEIFASAPNMLREGNLLLNQLNKLVGDNAANITEVVANSRALTARLVGISDKVERMVVSVEELAVAAKGLVKEDARQVMIDARAAAAEGRKALTELAQIVAENRPPVREFTKHGLPSVLFLIDDTRQLIATFDRFAQRLERSPSSLLFGDKTSEFGSGR